MSKCNFAGKFKELADLINSNTNLRSLSLQRVQMNDTQALVLVQPIAESINLEVLKFDYNSLGSVFIEKLTQKMLLNPV